MAPAGTDRRRSGLAPGGGAGDAWSPPPRPPGGRQRRVAATSRDDKSCGLIRGSPCPVTMSMTTMAAWHPRHARAVRRTS